MVNNSKIYVAGHRRSCRVCLTAPPLCQRLLKYRASEAFRTRFGRLAAGPGFLCRENPEFVFLAAAKVGGILANSTYPVDFLLRNIKIQTNVIEAAWRYGVKGSYFWAAPVFIPNWPLNP